MKTNELFQSTRIKEFTDAERILVQAQDLILDAIYNPEADQGLASAERALFLINVYLQDR